MSCQDCDHNKPFIYTEKASHKVMPINPSLCISFDTETDEFLNRKDKYLIRFFTADPHSKTPFQEWRFVDETVRDAVFDQILCCLGQAF